MAAFKWMYKVNFNDSGPKTVCQFKAPTNQRLKLRRIELIPKGSTGASIPLDFDLGLQDDAGTSTDDSSAMQKSAPVAAETIQATVRKSFTVEPTTSTPKDFMSLHMQGARTWEPVEPIVVEGNTRLGFRYLSSLTVDCDFAFHFEE